MSQTRTVSLSLGATYIGALSRLRAQLYDTTGALVGGLVSSGFAAIGSNGDFVFVYDYLDDFRGAVQFFDTNDGLPIPNLPVVAFDPEGASASAGAGPNLVNLTVQDGDGNNLSGVSVRLVIGIYSYSNITDINGVASFGLENGTYTLVMEKSGYEYTPTEETISGDEDITRVMSATVVPSSSNPLTTNATLYTYDRTGALEGNVDITFKLIAGPGEAGQSHYSRQFIKSSDSLGLLMVTLLRSSTYQAWRGDNEDAVRVTFTTDATGSYLLPEILGWE